MELKIIVPIDHKVIIEYIETQLNCKLKFIILFSISARIEGLTHKVINNFDISLNKSDLVIEVFGQISKSNWKPVENDGFDELEVRFKELFNEDYTYSFDFIYSEIRDKLLSLYYDSLVKSHQIKPYKLPINGNIE